MIRTYRNATCIITGGASGIGKALGQALARKGAEVVLADLQADLVHETAEAIRLSGGNARAWTLDVRDGDAVEQLVASARRLDYVFANAGMGIMGEANLMQRKEWDQLIDVNVRGVTNTVAAAYPRMVKQGYGHFIGTASVAGLMGTPFLAGYSMSKFAVVGLMKAMRIEGVRHGVRVTALCPGAIRTPILTGGAFGKTLYEMTDERKLAWWSKTRPGEVDVFAHEVLEQLAKNKGVIVLPKHNRIMLELFRLVPGLEEKTLGKMLGRTLKDFPEMNGSS